MNCRFESDYQKKILYVNFDANAEIKSAQDVRDLKEAWLATLKSWHSPYKALIDCTTLTLNDSDEVKKELTRLFDFLSRLFLKKAIGFGFQADKGHGILPFPVLEKEEEALQQAGLGARERVKRDDFRSLILFENHFKGQMIELSFDQDVVVESTEEILVLKSKLTNNLMHWHSSWNLLIDCSKLVIAPKMHEPWNNMMKFFRGFFLRDVLGYQPKAAEGISYPFTCLRSRHVAVARLKPEALGDGEKANCASR